MKIKELRRKPIKELEETLIGLRDKLRELRFNLAGGKVKNIKEIHQTKRDIAKILTILKENASPKAGQPRAEKTKINGKEEKNK